MRIGGLTINRSIKPSKWIEVVELQLRDLALNPERFGYAPENGLFTIERADLQLDVRLKDVLVNRIGLGTLA